MFIVEGFTIRWHFGLDLVDGISRPYTIQITCYLWCSMIFEQIDTGLLLQQFDKSSVA